MKCGLLDTSCIIVIKKFLDLTSNLFGSNSHYKFFYLASNSFRLGLLYLSTYLVGLQNKQKTTQ